VASQEIVDGEAAVPELDSQASKSLEDFASDTATSPEHDSPARGISNPHAGI
jgi:hypothetical protein